MNRIINATKPHGNQLVFIKSAWNLVEAIKED